MTAHFQPMPAALRRKLFFSLLLALTVPLVSCDSGGSSDGSQNEGPQLEDLHSTNRLITSEGADGEVFDATESELDYYYRDDSDGSDVHICLGDDTIVKGRLSDISTDVNSSGNLVRTQEIVNADGVVLYDEENEGGTTTLEYLEIGTDVGETTRFEVQESDQSSIEGNTDTVRGIEEIPETDEDCANREDFHN